MAGRHVRHPVEQSDVTGFRAGVVFSILMVPLYFIDMPLIWALGLLLDLCMIAALFAPKSLFWLTIGTYVISGFVYASTGTVPTFSLFANSLSLHEIVWVSVSCGSIFSLLTRPQGRRWSRLRWRPSRGAMLALAALVVLAVAATVNTFLFGSEGRWSTAIRFALPAIPLMLALRSAFDPQDLPRLMQQVRRVGIMLLVLVLMADFIFLLISYDQQSVGVYSHLIMFGLVYTWLELLTMPPNIAIKQVRRWMALVIGAFVYFILNSDGQSDMWMFAWAAALGLLAAGRVSGKSVMMALGRLIIVTLVVGVVAIYLLGPAGFISGNQTISDIESSPIGAFLSYIGDSAFNTTDHFIRMHIAIDRIVADPFALQFSGYGSEGDIQAAFRIYGYYLSNLVAHNVFLDLALWLTPLAPPLLVFLLWRFWRSMLQAAVSAPRGYQLLMATCAIAVPLYWIRDFWGTWIVQGYFGASFSFWLVVVLCGYQCRRRYRQIGHSRQ